MNVRVNTVRMTSHLNRRTAVSPCCNLLFMSSADPKDSPQPLSESPENTRHNFVTMVAYQVLLRTGWIFKTESVLMPSFLDHLGTGAWVRGLLPVFNRLGQSFPPLMANHWLAQQSFKKRVVAASTLAMSFCFLILSLGYLFLVRGAAPEDSGAWAMPWLFVVTYAVFFSCFGINQLAQNTLQGKVIPVRRRGALMAWGSLIGVVLAVSSAVWLLPRWLDPSVAAFEKVFGVTGGVFLLAGLLAFRFREQPDRLSDRGRSGWRSLVDSFHSAFQVLWSRAEFRRLGLVAAAFGMNMVLFPHYQALFRDYLGTDLSWLMYWLVAQNLGAAFFNVVAGRIADRAGNGIALKLTLLLQVSIPLLSLGCALSDLSDPWLTIPVFFVLGSTPVTYRLFSNFTLELTDQAQHPQYLSALALCLSVPPMLLSVPTGLLVDSVGFLPVFLTISGIAAGGFLLMQTVADPRHA